MIRTNEDFTRAGFAALQEKYCLQLKLRLIAQQYKLAVFRPKLVLCYGLKRVYSSFSLTAKSFESLTLKTPSLHEASIQPWA